LTIFFFGLFALPALAQNPEPVDMDGDGHEDLPAGEEGYEEDVMAEPLTPEQLKTIHDKADTDADGKVTLEEIMKFSESMKQMIAKRGVESAMQDMDRNGDGALDLSEVTHDEPGHDETDAQVEYAEEEQSIKDAEEARFKAADVNGDGLLQAPETFAFFYPESDNGALTLAAAATMESKDTNLDGKLTLKEFWEGGGGGTPEEKDDFTKLDTSGDGQVDMEELKAWESGTFDGRKVMAQLITLADKDGDGRLTHAELAAETEEIAKGDAQHTLMEWALHYDL